MGSLQGSSEAVGPDFLNDLFTIMGGIDGLVGAFFGSLGDMIGVGGGGA
ncbi:MAG TPA: hypothetical protein H9755_03305 [Candidatus Dietzia intestinigallinarum]|nr:hypothetical protein [Candidatus Dietzia intestinigallinarum]